MSGVSAIVHVIDFLCFDTPMVCATIIIIIFLAHQHKACRQLKIKQKMTAVGD